MESVTSKAEEAANLWSIKITIEGHIATIYEALNLEHRNCDILIDSIVNARKWILQPEVVPPSLLFEALIQSSPSFPKDTFAPFPSSKD
jgi:hypothetical protein